MIKNKIIYLKLSINILKNSIVIIKYLYIHYLIKKDGKTGIIGFRVPDLNK